MNITIDPTTLTSFCSKVTAVLDSSICYSEKFKVWKTIKGTGSIHDVTFDIKLRCPTVCVCKLRAFTIWK